MSVPRNATPQQTSSSNLSPASTIALRACRLASDRRRAIPPLSSADDCRVKHRAPARHLQQRRHDAKCRHRSLEEHSASQGGGYLLIWQPAGTLFPPGGSAAKMTLLAGRRIFWLQVYLRCYSMLTWIRPCSAVSFSIPIAWVRCRPGLKVVSAVNGEYSWSKRLKNPLIRPLPPPRPHPILVPPQSGPPGPERRAGRRLRNSRRARRPKLPLP